MDIIATTPKDRVIAEEADLGAKLDKVDADIAGDAFNDLTAIARDLLMEQRLHVSNYRRVLQARIAEFDRPLDAPAIKANRGNA